MYVQKLADDLVEDVYFSPFDICSFWSVIDEIESDLEGLVEFEEVEGFLELVED